MQQQTSQPPVTERLHLRITSQYAGNKVINPRSPEKSNNENSDDGDCAASEDLRSLESDVLTAHRSKNTLLRRLPDAEKMASVRSFLEPSLGTVSITPEVFSFFIVVIF